jgi:hypothetical protein
MATPPLTSTVEGAVDPLVMLIRSQPGMAQRLLAQHTDDGTGRCRVCSGGGQTGRFRWPCTLHRCATDAQADGP